MQIKTPVLVDTNIPLYSLDKESKYYNFSRTVLTGMKDSIFIPGKAITEFVAVLSKIGKYHIIENELSNLIANFNILYPDATSISIFNRLVKKYRPTGNRVYDCEIVSIMYANNIKDIVTINKKDFDCYDEIIVHSK